MYRWMFNPLYCADGWKFITVAFNTGLYAMNTETAFSYRVGKYLFIWYMIIL